MQGVYPAASRTNRGGNAWNRQRSRPLFGPRENGPVDNPPVVDSRYRRPPAAATGSSPAPNAGYPRCRDIRNGTKPAGVGAPPAATAPAVTAGRASPPRVAPSCPGDVHIGQTHADVEDGTSTPRADPAKASAPPIEPRPRPARTAAPYRPALGEPPTSRILPDTAARPVL
ncbi:hypothetical protein Pen01_42430 [Phytomonospora endophytica]|nr:hypothetical protein Pen01_42430 [Phytomonospora endophytica]